MGVRQRAKAVFDLSRGTQALLSVAQPALGALLAAGTVPPAEMIGVGLAASVCGYLAVFSLNDVLDRGVDARALPEGKAEPGGFDIDTAFLRHPLARGDLTLAFSVAWVAGLAAVALALAWMLEPLCALLFVSAAVLEVAYCALRSVTWLKTLVSGVMVGVGGLAGWAAVAPLDGRAWSFFAFLALWEIAGRNLPNDLADVVADGATGVRTVATVFGGRVSALATLAGAVATVAVTLALPAPPVARASAAALGVWSMALPASVLARRPSSDLAARYFNRASLLPALVLLPLLALRLMGR